MFHKVTLAATVAAFAVAVGTAQAAGSDLQVFDWSGYEDPGFFGEYVNKHGEAPAYTFFGDQEEAFTKLRAGFAADLAHPCTDATRKWADAGLIKPLDTSKLAHWDGMLASIKDLGGIQFDGKTWMLPFDWGNTGLIYRTDEVSAEDVSLQHITGEAFADRVAIPDAATSAYAMAALATGVEDWAGMSDAEFSAASDYLRALHPNIRFYWSDPGQLDQAMTSGEVLAGWGWNQSELNLIWNEVPAAMMRDLDKGIATWVCGYVHLTSSTTPDDQVYDMLNALSDPASGKYIIEAWGYAHANSEAYAMADQALVEQYGFNDPEAFMAGSLHFVALPPELEQRMIKEFERIKSGF